MAESGGRKSLAVIGGGAAGIAACLEAAASGRFDISLFEKKPAIGGLCGSFAWNGREWDRFYHVCLPGDRETRRFLDQLGLGESLAWRRVRSGYLDGGRVRSLASLPEIIRFPGLSAAEKIRLLTGAARVQLTRDPIAVDRLNAVAWARRIFGGGAYAKVWGPLLKSKFGSASARMSAVYLWSSLRRLSGNRAPGKGEQMGYWRGGCASLVRAAEGRLRRSGIRVFKGVEVLQVKPAGEERKSAAGRLFLLHTSEGEKVFDAVAAAVPLSVLPEIIEPSLLGDAARGRLLSLEDLGLINVVLILRKSLSPYYVLNLLDEGFPFTGVIEPSHVMDGTESGGYSVVHLPRYLTKGDPLSAEDDGRITQLFIDKLGGIFPSLLKSDILHTAVFRTSRVQPLHGPGFLAQAPSLRLLSPGLALAAYPHLRNLNADLAEGRQAVAALLL